MDPFIETLVGEHRALAAALAQIEALGVATPEGRAAAHEFSQLMHRHRQNEEELLYPLLETLDDRATAALIGSMKAASADSTRRALALVRPPFDEASHAAPNRALADLRTALAARIAQEESALYPIYARLAEAAARFRP